MSHVIFVSSLRKKETATAFTAHFAVALSSKYKTAIVGSENVNHFFESFFARRYAFNLSHKTELVVPAFYRLKKNILEEISSLFDFVFICSDDLLFLKDADTFLSFFENESDFTPSSHFLNAIWNAKKERANKGKSAFDFVVVFTEENNAEKINKNSQMLGYRIAPVLQDVSLYHKVLQTGISFIDKDAADFKDLFDLNDFLARRNLKGLIEFILADK